MIENEITKELDIRPSSVLLWISIFAGAIAFAIDMESRYALVQWACLSHRAWVIDLITATAFIAAAGGALLGWTAYARLDAAMERARFMGLSGFILSAFFALCILANDVPHLFLSTCD